MTEFNHDEWVKKMQEYGHMAEDGNPKTPSATDQPARSLSEPASTGEPSPSDGGAVEVKYLGHGGYEAAGVEVKRNGQTVDVDEATANELTTLTGEDGTALFERV